MKGAKPRFDHQAAADLYRAGITIIPLAKHFGVSPSAIRGALIKHGLLNKPIEKLTHWGKT